MIAHQTIEKSPAYDTHRNYEWLRSEGIAFIEKIAGEVWNEYNSTDPGVTLLEVICYAITDLGMRMDMPMQNLLASSDSSLLGLHQQFHTALEIMPNAPVTELDYRKLFVNIRGVKNAWLQTVTKPVYVDFKVNNQVDRPRVSYTFFPDSRKTRSFEMRGFYEVLVEYEDDIYRLGVNARKEAIALINEQLRKVYHRNRNLCEDLVAIHQVPKQEVVVCGEIELMPNANANKTNARILQVIQTYLTPDVPFYTLEELMEDGRSTEEIFNGPLLLNDSFAYPSLLQALRQKENLAAYIQENIDEVTKLLGTAAELLSDIIANESAIRQKLWDELLFHGFIKTEDLLNSGLKREIRSSDIINLVLELEEVKEVRDLFIGLCGKHDAAADHDDCGCDNISPDENPWKICLDGTAQPTLCFKSSNFRFFKDFLPINVQKEYVLTLWDEMEARQRTERFATRLVDLPLPSGQYHHIDSYSAIQNDLPDAYGVGQMGVPPTAEEDLPKRKAEAFQLKAYLQFFEQILATYFKQLSKVGQLLSVNQNLSKTYFTQITTSVKDLHEIFHSKNPTDVLSNWIAEKDDKDTRQHQIFDHLIGRFAERFGEYAFTLFDRFDHGNTQELLQHKSSFLKDYPRLSSRRFSAYNYYESSDSHWGTDNVNGVQRRLARLGGFDTEFRASLYGVAYEFYQEHDTDNISEFRWRIRDDQRKIILSSSTNYKDKKAAVKELGSAFESAKSIDNLIVDEAEDGTFYFNVENDANEVIGRRIEYFTTMEEAQAAMNYVASYLQDKTIAAEGMHLVEHILLRPAEPEEQENDDTVQFFPICHDMEKDACKPLDKYSFQVSVILPGWPRRFGTPEYRQFLERLIRLEMPAHILPKICWVSPEDMLRFETNYQQLLALRADAPGTPISKDVLQDFVATLDSMRTVYWPGTLHDCVDEGSAEEDNPIVLNRTFLGDLQNPVNDVE